MISPETRGASIILVAAPIEVTTVGDSIAKPPVTQLTAARSSIFKSSGVHIYYTNYQLIVKFMVFSLFIDHLLQR